MKVGVRGHFDSSHHLPGHPKCGVPHGHTYTVEATVEGPVKDGMVVDFDDLKSALGAVVDTLDHRDLNGVIDMPTCENICVHIHGALRNSMTAEHISIRVWEGDGKWAEYGD